jgi:glycosyltransferase involved in cell wall biosynthesis
MKDPVISVIMATYNRSNIIAFSIGSVIGQTFTDWELIVVGDCCTDDSERVVNHFNDPRITFINLEKNVGEQSGPNNEGLRRARGQYIAFLNHDDLWFSDHLAFSLDFLKTSNADLVLAAGFIDHDQENHALALSGVVSEKYGYHPSRIFVPASNWLFQRELIGEIGFWKPAGELFLVPSHDWLKRTFEAGKVIVPTRHFSVVALPSSSRKNAYKDRLGEDSAYYHHQLKTNPHFREVLLSRQLYHCFEKLYFDEDTYYWRFFTKKIKTICIRLGFNTIELHLKRRFGKGGLLQSYRQKRGLNLNSFL